jgi:hypothetical protein
LKNAKAKYETACDEFCESHSDQAHEDEEAKAYLEQIKELSNNQGKQLMTLFSEYEKVYNEKDRVYHHYMNSEESEALDSLRSDLL